MSCVSIKSKSIHSSDGRKDRVSSTDTYQCVRDHKLPKDAIVFLRKVIEIDYELFDTGYLLETKFST